MALETWLLRHALSCLGNTLPGRALLSGSRSARACFKHQHVGYALTTNRGRANSDEMDARNLGLFRILYCGNLLFWMCQYKPLFSQLTPDRIYHPVPLFSVFSETPLSPELFTLSYYALLFSLLMVVLGLRVRCFLLLTFALYLVVMGTFLGFLKSPYTNYVFHSASFPIFICFILAISPGVDRLSILEVIGMAKRRVTNPSMAPSWPKQLVIATLAFAYLGAACARLQHGLAWLDGETLEAYFLERWLLNDNEIPWMLAQNKLLVFGAGILTMLFELSFWVVLFLPQATPIYALGGLFFHVANFVVMDIDFLRFFASAYLIFLSPFSNSVEARSESDRKTVPSLRECIALLYIGIIASVTVLRIEFWPFSDYAVFANPNHWSRVNVHKVRIEEYDGKNKPSQRWATSSDFRLVPPVVFLSRFQKSILYDDQDYRDRLVKDLIASATSRIKGPYKIAVVQRSVERDKNGEFSPKELKVFESDLLPSPGSKSENSEET